MNVLFIYSQDLIHSVERPLEYPEYAQIGVSYISAMLKQHGHATRVVVVSPHFLSQSKGLIEQAIAEFAPEVIGYTAVSTQYPFLASIADSIRRRHPRIYHLIGGAHASLNPDDVIAGPFDALCVGEGEFPTVELVSQLQEGAAPKDIANLWIKREGAVQRNPTRPFLQDLDALPFPDRQMWLPWINMPSRPRMSVLIGRGCPFQCSYCCNHALARLADEPYVRYRSPENILTEIEAVVKQHPTTGEVYLEVECFGLKRNWTLELCRQLEAFNAARRRPVAFGANLRVYSHCEFDEIFAAMRRANFTFVNIGLESGSERIRREVLCRRYANEDIFRTVSQARTHGLKVALFNLIGIPGETPDDFDETVEVNRVCRPDWHHTSIFYPYPGTQLHALCERENLLGDAFDQSAMERTTPSLDLPNFSRREIAKRYIWFDYYVHKGIWPMYRIVPLVLRAKLRSKPRLMSLARRVLRRVPLVRRLMKAS